MNKNDYLDALQKKINTLEFQLSLLDEKDYVARGILLGEINGLYTAKLWTFDLEEK